ncbi:peptidylglycine alpha-hydroxylating monooxygenase [Trichonephila clavipes]|nr:peptidylglycine alpha-hydroxylating monooxygenase [Trichonephila clavipes]
MHTAHHILLYGCELPGKWQRDSPRIVWDCGEMSGQKSGFQRGPTCSSGSQIIYAWAKDAPPLHLPEGLMPVQSVEAQSPIVGVVTKFGEGNLPAQVSQ